MTIENDAAWTDNLHKLCEEYLDVVEKIRNPTTILVVTKPDSKEATDYWRQYPENKERREKIAKMVQEGIDWLALNKAYSAGDEIILQTVKKAVNALVQ